MEFLRFGSSIPGSYWGCCAVCIIQNFNFDPATPHAIQIVDGDGGYPCGDNYAGLTYEEVFRHRIRFGTFSAQDMPNHAFLAVLTRCQLSSDTGKAWLRILKEEGFEFIRTIDNSVYTGEDEDGEEIYNEETDEYEYVSSDVCSPHPNYMFGLFRNITASRIVNPFEPPPEWTALPSVSPEPLELISPAAQVTLAAEMTATHSTHYEETAGKYRFYSRKEVEEAKVPVTLAGQRSEFLQELETARLKRQKLNAKLANKTFVTAYPSSFPSPVLKPVIL